MRLLLIFLLLGFLERASHCLGYEDLGGNIYRTTGTPADFQAAHDSIPAGGTVRFTGGSFTWTTGVSVTKNIRIEGAGSGRIIARSISSVAVGTGAKTFTTQAGLTINAGQTLTIFRTGGVHSGGAPTGDLASMTGTVTSYSGTSLVMDIASVVGTGTHPVWCISTPSTTTITHDAGDNILIAVTESTTGSVEISGLRVINDSNNVNYSLNLGSTIGGQPILVHDCWFSSKTGSSVRVKTNRGVIWNCSFESTPYASARLGIEFKAESLTTSWTTAPTMGSADTTGVNNFYVEDCDFHAFQNSVDIDDNIRLVLRHCLFNNASIATHGPDGSDHGYRHFEVCDSVLVFNGYSDGQTMNIDRWFFIRGGTFAVTDNTVDVMTSGDYGARNTFKMMVMSLRRDIGIYNCWGASTGGVQYPAPHQAGWGNNGTVDVVDPIHIWGNTGTITVGVEDYSPNECGVNADSSTDYIVAGRDYFNDGTAKPGYTKKTYPHPLRTDIAHRKLLRLVP